MGAGDLRTKTLRHSSWDDGEEVIIRDVTYAENLAMLEACTIKIEGKEDEIDNTKFSNLLLAKSIVSWTLTKDGKVMKLNQSSFDAIKGWVMTYIMEQIGELSPKTDEDFPNPTGNGAQGESEPPA